MVASTNGELYTPFQHPLAPIEDSSEEGSGLHSPVFGAPFPPHGDIRYNPDQGDFNAVSQFDYAANNGHHQPHPINTYPLVDPQQHPNLQPQTSSNEIPLHSPHSPTNNRLPPPPSADFFHSSSERRLPPFAPLDVASTSSSSSSGMPMDSNSNHSARQPSSSHIPNTSRRTEESSSPTTDRGNNSSSTRESARKEISMVVIACRQCRARKIRCDSTRPVCNNCVRRSNPCEYDLVPKRRGPDKRPGTRQRSCKKRPADGSAPSPNTAPPPSKRKRTMSAQAEDVKKENDTPPRRPSGLMIDTQGSGRHQPPSGSPLDYPPSARSIEGVILKGPPSGAVRQSALTIPPLEKGHQSFHGIPPSSDYNRNTWWDNLIGTYSTGRDQAVKEITSDLQYLFSATGYWLSFINVNVFMRSLYNPDERARMQPALVYAALALTTLMRSSELELGASGRSRAMWLRDVAQSELDKSWNTQFIDYMLAEAALLLALFESSAHPTHSLDRLSAALVTLDGIISVLNLTCLDVSDRAATHFGARHVPVASDDAPKPAKCTCISHNTLPADHFSSSWTYSPPWDPAWNPTEVRNEECRRLCWCALNLVAAFTAQCAVFQRETPDFFLANSANYALFFPGESMSHASAPTHRGPSPQSPKDSVWAIYCRSMLLWNFCLKLRKENCSDEDRAEYALEAWIETQAILDALETHICNLDTAILYMCREYIYNSRMTITQTFRRLVPDSDIGSSIAPVFNRKHAEEWLYYQAQVIQLVKQSVPQLGETQGHMLTRRPFQVGWFTSQLAICLSLWNHDHSLINALDLAKSILMPLDVLNALWPCPMQQNQCESLRKRLSEACTAAGLPQPLPTEYNLPAALRGR